MIRIQNTNEIERGSFLSFVPWNSPSNCMEHSPCYVLVLHVMRLYSPILNATNCPTIRLVNKTLESIRKEAVVV